MLRKPKQTNRLEETDAVTLPAKYAKHLQKIYGLNISRKT